MTPCVAAPERFCDRFSEGAQPGLTGTLHRQAVFLVLVLGFNSLCHPETGGCCLNAEARTFLLSRAGPGRRCFIGPVDELRLAVEISQDMPSFIQKEKICLMSRQFADERSRPLPGRKRQNHDPVVSKSADVIQTRALEVGPKELTKG